MRYGQFDGEFQNPLVQVDRTNRPSLRTPTRPRWPVVFRPLQSASSAPLSGAAIVATTDGRFWRSRHQRTAEALRGMCIVFPQSAQFQAECLSLQFDSTDTCNSGERASPRGDAAAIGLHQPKSKWLQNSYQSCWPRNENYSKMHQAFASLFDRWYKMQVLKSRIP